MQIRLARVPHLAVAGFALMAVAGPEPLVAQAPAFDVASVKTNHSGSGGSRFFGLRNGTFRAENVTLKTLLSEAYGMGSFRIAGPDWIDSDKFDLEAKSPAGVPDSQMGPMLQSLLRERFMVAVHRETKEVPAFDMVVAKSGVRIHLVDPEHPPGPPPRYAGGATKGGVGTMREIADRLAANAGRPIVDRTGVEGTFAYFLNYAPLSAQPSDGAADSGPPDFFEAMEQQLGLKLEPKKEPIEILVVDRAERVPTPN
jgi:uncharacterized protein (TIGR03435 family)